MIAGGKAASQSATTSTAFVDVSVKGRPFLGPKGAAVTVVEFTDYQCPFCERFFKDTYRPLLKAYKGKIRFVVRNFPIAQLHPLAEKAAEAAECANDQGKFWEYHDVLFTKQDKLDVESLKQNASDLHLDSERFDKCLDNGDKADVVQADLNDGTRYGVTGTPTFFVNGERLTGAQPLEAFRASIDAKLKKSTD
jgi:protein-disulfide isomerase